MKYYLAVDIGASSGRLILGHREDGRMILEEIHRFGNGMVRKQGHLVWDVDQLFAEIITGMKKCAELGKIPESIGVDTWAVDFVLLDAKDQRLGDAVGYRDHRTQGMDQSVYEVIDEEELYLRTGIQKQPFNTIYQLMAVKEQIPELMEQADALLMIPDYLHFLLSGQKVTEYTNASTTQLLDPQTKDWDWNLIDWLGYKRELFQKICLPGTNLGSLTAEIAAEVGFTCKVVVPATHDTGAAVMAVPAADDQVLYISSGTWSLMGTEVKEAICTAESRQFNFTNEGGYDYRFRYLKNIMGMWMINSARNELAPDMSFSDICEGAAKQSILSIVDANSERFLAPESMSKEVQKACAESGQQVPQGIWETAAVIYNSLAECYAQTAREIEAMTGVVYDCIHVIGGGANAEYLNRLTAHACHKKIYAGPVEATAIGNISAQMIAAGELENLKTARECIYHSFDITEYEAE
ncbi:rhamnulokinase [Eubacterium ramulus]|mgnify:FL=1